MLIPSWPFATIASPLSGIRALNLVHKGSRPILRNIFLITYMRSILESSAMSILIDLQLRNLGLALAIKYLMKYSVETCRLNLKLLILWL